MFGVLSFKASCLFAFNHSGINAMGGVLKGINQDNKKYDRSLNSYKVYQSLEDA